MFDFKSWTFNAMPTRDYQKPFDQPWLRGAVAFAYGATCHGIFLLAALSMVAGMFMGMTAGQGRLSQPWSWVANTLLILQFPLAHSLLLTSKGQKALRAFAPKSISSDLATTTYVVLASAQLLLLFVGWTPSGIVWWEASGWAWSALSALYGVAWLSVGKASFDAGFEVQSGLLGWVSLARGVKPVYPDMPTHGQFAYSRQPIYSSFALTLWTVPVWTPDQLFLATSLTLYCLIGPLFKERRFAKLFGARFAAYQDAVPYWLPRRPSRRSRKTPQFQGTQQ